MLYCYKCGTQIADNSLFCFACGQAQPTQNEQAQSAPHEQVQQAKQETLVLQPQDYQTVVVEKAKKTSVFNKSFNSPLLFGSFVVIMLVIIFFSTVLIVDKDEFDRVIKFFSYNAPQKTNKASVKDTEKMLNTTSVRGKDKINAESIQTYTPSNNPISPDSIRAYDLEDKNLWHNRFASALTDYYRRSQTVTMSWANAFLTGVVDSSGAFEIKPSTQFKSNIGRYRSRVGDDERIILKEMKNAIAYCTAYSIDDIGFQRFEQRASFLILLATM